MSSALRTAALFAAAAALSACTILREIAPHDEGLMLQAAARIAGGEWPYRDFWFNYGPGQPLLLGALWKAFGPSLLTWRIVRVALDATVSVLAYAIVRRAAPAWLALLAWAAVAAAMAWPSGPGPNPAALALVLAALLLARRSPLGAGALCGLAALFRPEIAGAGALGVALYGGGARSLLAAAGTTAVLWLPFLVVAGGDLLDDTIGFLGVQDLQRLPLPLHYRGAADPNKLLEFYFPALLLAAGALWLVRRRALWLAPLALAGALYLLARPDEFHLVPLSVVLAIGLAVAAAGERSPVWRGALVAALALIAVHGLERRAGQLLHPPALARVPSGVANGVKTTPADARALAALLPRLRGRSVFVAPPRFDRVRVGDPLLYVLAGQPNPTRYDVIQPGVVTTAKAQREMVRALARARPRLLVRWLDPRALALEPNGSARSSGVTLLDDTLRRDYGAARRFGPYVLLRRRAVKSPAMPSLRISVPLLLAVLAMPAHAAAHPGDAKRFAEFAKHARGTGTLNFSISFKSDPRTCTQAGTCGLSGTVTTHLALRSTRGLRVGTKVVRLPAHGIATAKVRDTVAGRECSDKVRIDTIGLAYTGDRKGLLLRPRAAPGDDPFSTHCHGPRLATFGTRALASGRLNAVVPNIGTLRLTVKATRLVRAKGYSATVTTSGRVRLTHK